MLGYGRAAVGLWHWHRVPTPELDLALPEGFYGKIMSISHVGRAGWWSQSILISLNPHRAAGGMLLGLRAVCPTKYPKNLFWGAGIRFVSPAPIHSWVCSVCTSSVSFHAGTGRKTPQIHPQPLFPPSASLWVLSWDPDPAETRSWREKWDKTCEEMLSTAEK